jgi:uncharacterized protein YjbI with pentapeptide repeats
MRWLDWGVGERRWKKSPDEEVRPAKTAWDVLQLLIVPVMLVAIALYFNASQASRDRSREDRRIREDRALAEDTREDATLDAYIAKMSTLIIDRELLRAPRGSPVRQVARTATLATVRRLSGSRKGEVVRFLLEAGLLAVPTLSDYSPGAPVINLEGADLRGVDLIGAELNASFSPTYGVTSGHRAIALSGDLRGARFDRAYLQGINFRGANLRGASFKGARIYGASFPADDLRNASFERAYLSDVVNLAWTRLDGAVFDDAIIGSGTTFWAAWLNNASFAGATIDAGTAFGAARLNHASFVGTTFEEPARGKSKTSFNCAEGRAVDFSDAVNLSSLDVRYAGLTDVRMDRAKGRPDGWGPTGSLHPERAKACG